LLLICFIPLCVCVHTDIVDADVGANDDSDEDYDVNNSMMVTDHS